MGRCRYASRIPHPPSRHTDLPSYEFSQVLQYAVEELPDIPSPEQLARQPVSPRLRGPDALHGELRLAAGELQVEVDARADAGLAVGPAEGGRRRQVHDLELGGAAVEVDLDAAAP